MSKIAIVGPIPRDTIRTYKGEVIQKYGCVSHPTIALAKLFEHTGSNVIPISHVHKEDEQAIRSIFNSYPAIVAGWY